MMYGYFIGRWSPGNYGVAVQSYHLWFAGPVTGRDAYHRHILATLPTIAAMGTTLDQDFKPRPAYFVSEYLLETGMVTPRPPQSGPSSTPTKEWLP